MSFAGCTPSTPTIREAPRNHVTLSVSVPWKFPWWLPPEVAPSAVLRVAGLVLCTLLNLGRRVAAEGDAQPQQVQCLPVYPESNPVRHKAIPAKQRIMSGTACNPDHDVRKWPHMQGLCCSHLTHFSASALQQHGPHPANRSCSMPVSGHCTHLSKMERSAVSL